jgi:sterol desaturase/sphingolipid hydroxylase (fatty acid hydroxylase superfamily)
MRQPTLMGIVVGFVVLTIVFRLLELTRSPEQRLKLFRSGYLTDLAYWLFTPLVTRTATAIAVAVAVAPFAYLIWGRLDRDLIIQGFGPMARLPLWAQAIALLAIGDFIGYWMHRAFHQGRLWRFHAVHHSSGELDWLSSVRLHPVNDIVMRVASAAPLLLTGLAPVALAGITPLLTLLAIALHANVDWDWGPLRAVVASPRFHRWHHTCEAEGGNGNFAGLLPLWDILFGTYYMPKGATPTRFGTDTAVPTGLFGQLVFPFRH